MSSTNKYTVKLTLCEKFKGIIWKVETDYKLNIVAIETRDAESHTTAISAFDFSTGRCLFKELQVEDSWNWGLDRVTSGIIFVHGYISEKSPEHKGIIALNELGEVAWQHYNKTLYTIAEEGLIAYNPSVQPRMLELLSPQNGQMIKYGIKEYNSVHRDIIVPVVVNQDALPDKSLAENIAGPILFAQFKGKDIFSFHMVNGNTFSQKLVVYEHDNIILNEFLAINIQKFNPEAFFIEHNHLFCIRNNKQEFVSYLV
ncbi:DUF4905 domain-containing protein [Arcticibacter tournemirensis]